MNTLNELAQKVLELMPDALFDEEHGSDEIMISTGLTIRDGKLVKLDDRFLD